MKVQKNIEKQAIKVQDKSFLLSCKMIELYAVLLKHSELELAEKMLSSSMNGMEAIHQAQCEANGLERIHAVSEALQYATDTRYWIKLIQMKNISTICCDDVVESLSEVIGMLTWLTMNDTNNKVKLVYQLN